MIVIGKYEHAIPLLQKGMTKEQVADFFKNKLNNLFVDYVEPKVRAKLDYLSKKVNKYAAKKNNFKRL